MARIGFVGLGNMGNPMARNLLKAGHVVRGFDMVPQAVERARKDGVGILQHAAATAIDAEIIITMLPAGPESRAVWLGDGGLLAAARPETLLIDCSTIDVATAQEIGRAAAHRGLEMLDAPVSGGVGGAEAGALTFMVGGTGAAFARARPILEVMGKNIFHAGGPGLGQAAKIVNNMILGISMIAVSEAFALAAAVGLDAQKVYDIVTKSSGQCWSISTYCPVPGPVPGSPANRDYAAGFTAAMMLKDLGLAQAAARDKHVNTALGAAAEAIYKRYCEGGGAPRDFSGIYQLVAQKIP